MVRITAIAGLLCLALASCGVPRFSVPSPSVSSTAVGPGDTVSLTIFAAASLADPFQEIGRSFEEVNPGVRVVFNFAGSQQLALQLEQGARADLFASADWRNMDRLVDAGLIVPDGPVAFAYNQMTVYERLDLARHSDWHVSIPPGAIHLIPATTRCRMLRCS